MTLGYGPNQSDNIPTTKWLWIWFDWTTVEWRCFGLNILLLWHFVIAFSTVQRLHRWITKNIGWCAIAGCVRKGFVIFLFLAGIKERAFSAHNNDVGLVSVRKKYYQHFILNALLMQICEIFNSFIQFAMRGIFTIQRKKNSILPSIQKYRNFHENMPNYLNWSFQSLTLSLTNLFAYIY